MATEAIRESMDDDGGDAILARLYELLVTTTDGQVRDPKTDAEWAGWVTATAMNNWLTGDTLIDWLLLNGRSKGSKPDQDYPDYDGVFSFTHHLVQRGIDFEKRVIAWLKEQDAFAEIGSRGPASRSIEHARTTVEAMAAGTPIIIEPVLRNPDNRTYGSPDVLCR